MVNHDVLKTDVGEHQEQCTVVSSSYPALGNYAISTISRRSLGNVSVYYVVGHLAKGSS